MDHREVDEFLYNLYMPKIESEIKNYKKSGFSTAVDVFSEALFIIKSNLAKKNSGISNQLKSNSVSKHELILKKTFEDILGYISSNNFNLIQNIKTGDAKATNSFYVSSFNKIKKLAYNSQLNNEEIRDVYHDSLIKLLLISRKKYFYLKANTQISSFIYSIYRRILLNKFKKHSFQLEKHILDDPDYAIHFEVPAENLIQTNKHVKIQRVITLLDKACRDLLSQRCVHGKFLKDIAIEMGISEGAVKMKLMRCKNKFKELYRSLH